MYASGNPRTKKALKELVASGAVVRTFSPSPLVLPNTTHDGIESVEGPHYPAPHTWYARVKVVDGVIVKVVS